ncbi:MAG: hypothetical protein WAN30_01340 [Acidimicrobiales bacterium]
MLLLVLALLWVAILVPIAVRYFRDSGTERSIESFYAEREMLSRQEYVHAPDPPDEFPDSPLRYEPERTRRPHLTVVHPDDTIGSLRARGTWDDWSRDYDYDDREDVAAQRRETNRYAAAYSSVPGDGFGSSYSVPYEEQGRMRVRRRRIFVSLLVLCLALTASTFVTTTSVLEDAAALAWVALLGFVVLALVAMGLGYLGTASVPRTSFDDFVYEPVTPVSDRAHETEYGTMAGEPPWRREAAPRRAFG